MRGIFFFGFILLGAFLLDAAEPKHDGEPELGNVSQGEFGNDVRTAQGVCMTRHLKEVIPTGVFWPWERTEFTGRRAGMELWQFAEHTMRLLRENGYDTIWVIHFDDDVSRLLALAEKHGLQVLLESKVLTFFYHPFKRISDIDAVARNEVERLGWARNFLGYVLKDEPLFHDLGWVNYVSDRLKAFDPARDCVFSVMNRQFATYMRGCNVPVIMTDMYYFFAPRSINGPNTPKESKSLLSNALFNAGKMSELHGKHYWFCGQIFQSYWGRHYRVGNHFRALAGGYHHWRMPTEGEVRWQAWEALRCGAKGIFFYVLYGPRTLETPPEDVKDPELLRQIEKWDALQRSAASWGKQPLAEQDFDLPPGEGMLDFDGTPTRQMLASAKVMHLVRRNEMLLLKLRKNGFPAFFPTGQGVSSETFRLPGSEKLYGIVVNNDCDNPQDARILLPANIRQVREIAGSQILSLVRKDEFFMEATVALDAGGGALLEADFATKPGIPLCNEEFDNSPYFTVALGKAGEVFHYGFAGYEMNHAIRLKSDGDGPVAVLKNLVHVSPGSAITRNLNARKQDGILYCSVEGKLRSAEVLAVTNKAGKEEQANFQHLKLKENLAAGGHGTLCVSKGGKTPFAVPIGTSELEFYLKDQNDCIDRIRLWFVPLP
ncbi:MAG: hypothetical protein IJJ33_08840 [Victivallales bacterium]|nr:hypothetical protein [Victivallales bacterium]